MATDDHVASPETTLNPTALPLEKAAQLLTAACGQPVTVEMIQHSAVLMPSHGRFVGASSIPFSEYKRKQGDRVGLNWRMPNVRGKRAVRHVVFDTNYWKSFVQARLAVAMGDRGCLSLFGDKPEQHRLFAEHITSEYRVKTEGRGRTVDEWKIRAEHSDNHWLDCLVGCAVAASMQGMVLFGTGAAPAARPKRLKLSELQRGRRSMAGALSREKEPQRGIACPTCGCRHFRVLYTRRVSGGRLRRRRECRHCGRRITTHERLMN